MDQETDISATRVTIAPLQPPIRGTTSARLFSLG
jgi:hypothetical protein